MSKRKLRFQNLRNKITLTAEEVKHVAGLAKLSLSKKDTRFFQNQLLITLNYVSRLQKLRTTGVEPTSQVTGLKNVFREDIIEKERILSRDEVLANAEKAYRGYFLIKAVLG